MAIGDLNNGMIVACVLLATFVLLYFIVVGNWDTNRKLDRLLDKINDYQRSFDGFIEEQVLRRD